MIKIKNYLSLINYKILFITLGFSTILVQVILIRELLNLFSNNELTIGLFLALWMILTGIGSYFSNVITRKKLSLKFLFVLINLLGIIPIFQFIIIIYLNIKVLSTGISFNFLQIVFVIFIFLLPFCIISGTIYTYLSRHISITLNKNLLDRCYSYEALGSFLGGILVYLCIYIWFNTFQILLINFFITLIVSSILYETTNRLFYRIYYTFLSIFFFTLIILKPDLYIRKKQFKEQELLYYKDTNYGSISITKYYEQIIFYKNNEILFSTSNYIYNEEITHYALSQRNKNNNILILSGFLPGLIQEIAKYNPLIIDYIEIDHNIFNISKKFMPSELNFKLNYIKSDPRRYVKKCNKKYDAILINIPPPSTTELNKYYTIEFFRETKKILSDSGVIIFSIPYTANYLSEEISYLTASIFRTLKDIFLNVIIIPTNKNFFVASDKPLTSNIISNLDKLKITSNYVNSFYYNANLVEQRQQVILKSFPQEVKINKDFRPISFLYQIKYWLNQISSKNQIVLYPTAIFFIILLVLFLKKGTEPGMIIIGFTASSFEIISILSYEIIRGYIHEAITLIFSIFMAGLTIGSYVGRNIYSKYYNNRKKIHMYVIITIIFFLLSLYYNHKISFIFSLLVYISNFIIAFLTGCYYSILTNNISDKQDYGEVAGKVYSSDLLGSAIGAILTSLFLVPILGFYFVVIILIILNILYIFFVQN